LFKNIKKKIFFSPFGGHCQLIAKEFFFGSKNQNFKLTSWVPRSILQLTRP
jgi:hypothetical protein